MDNLISGQHMRHGRKDPLQRPYDDALAHRRTVQPYATPRTHRLTRLSSHGTPSAVPTGLNQLDLLFTPFFFSNLFSDPALYMAQPPAPPMTFFRSQSRWPSRAAELPRSLESLPEENHDGPCDNCGQLHFDDHTQRNCIFLTIKRSGRAPIQIAAVAAAAAAGDASQRVPKHGLRFPKQDDLRIRLRDYIWDEFEFMRDDTEEKRKALAAQNVLKGDLRLRLPIPWLSWKLSGGRGGHVRNKANFIAIWERFIEGSLEGVGPGGMDVILTSTMLPVNGEQALFGEEGLFGEDHGEA